MFLITISRYLSRRVMMSPEEAYDLLEAIATISGSLDKLKRVKQKKADNAIKNRKPPINFKECQIPIGAELVYVEDPSVRVIVCDERSLEKVPICSIKIPWKAHYSI